MLVRMPLQSCDYVPRVVILLQPEESVTNPKLVDSGGKTNIDLLAMTGI